MNKIILTRIAILLQSFLLMGLGGVQKAEAQHGSGLISTSYNDSLMDVPLYTFSPHPLKPAHELAQKGQWDKARAYYSKAMAQYPDDLVPFLGILQCDPQGAKSLVPSLEQEFKRNPGAEARFRLGAALLYWWAIDRDTDANRTGIAKSINIPRLDRAVSLLKQAWKEDKRPVVGMTLFVSTELSCQGKYNSNFVNDNSGLREAIFQQTMGEVAYKQYKKGEQRKWNIAPPSAKLTPVANRKLLYGFLLPRLTAASGQGSTGYGIVGGKRVQFKEDPTERSQKRNYFESWVRNLEHTEMTMK